MAFMFSCWQSDEERLRDQREREQLEQNIRERDAAGTRKVHICFLVPSFFLFWVNLLKAFYLIPMHILPHLTSICKSI